jgi:transglutaminase-like putative cysteine protease
VQGHSVLGPVDRIVVTVAGEVETAISPVCCAATASLSRRRPTLRDTAPTRPDLALTELGREAVAGKTDPLDAAHGWPTAVATAIAYSPGTTHAHTTAAEALALGEGVCQDHTHALIAAARSQSMPARYVSGYLHATEDGSPARGRACLGRVMGRGPGLGRLRPANPAAPMSATSASDRASIRATPPRSAASRAGRARKP